MKASPAAAATRSGAGPSDAALVVAARAGEDWAREALFRRHAPRLNGLAFRVMGRDADVDDLVQDTFIAALSTLDRLQKPDAFSAWIGGILVRQAYKRLRRRRLMARLGLVRKEDPIDLDAIVAPSSTPERGTELRAIYAALHEMDADLRIPLVLHRVDGMGLDEVAIVTGMSLATVKRRIARADEILRARFGMGKEERV